MTCMLFGLLFVQMVRVFDITRPGRDFESRPTSKTRKSKHGQRCVCLGCPEFGLPPVTFACGVVAGASFRLSTSTVQVTGT